jgi:gallate decarboxylase subunit D
MDENLSFFRLEEGGYLVEAMLQRLGCDFLVSLWVGVAHIGAVAMAQSRPSIADTSRLSATASVFCYVGHKEDEVVKEVSELMASALGAKVVVVAGLHWDDLDPMGIEKIRANVRALVQEILISEHIRVSHE